MIQATFLICSENRAFVVDFSDLITDTPRYLMHSGQPNAGGFVRPPLDSPPPSSPLRVLPFVSPELRQVIRKLQVLEVSHPAGFALLARMVDQVHHQLTEWRQRYGKPS